MRIVDLRSDTVTMPTLKMRWAMKEAEVGDDSFGEDPTTNRFERIAAGKLGKEVAVSDCHSKLIMSEKIFFVD